LLVIYNLKVIDDSTLRDNLGAAVNPSMSADEEEQSYVRVVWKLWSGLGSQLSPVGLSVRQRAPGPKLRPNSDSNATTQPPS